MFFKKKPSGKGKTQEELARQAVQDWLPFYDAYNGVILRRDEHLVAALKIEPLNISLKSDAEKKRIISAVHEAINGLQDAIQILCFGRPVDLDAYLQSLEEKARLVSGTRKTLLRNYIRYVAQLAAGGEAMEMRYYLLLSQAPGKDAREELLKRAWELRGNLSRSGLVISLCDDQDLMDLLFVFLNPSQAAYEKPPLSGLVIPTQVG